MMVFLGQVEEVVFYFRDDEELLRVCEQEYCQIRLVYIR